MQLAPFSLLPCANASNPVGCFAVATDTQDGDLSPSIQTRDVTCKDPTDTDCLTCTVTSLTLGTCPKGQHFIEYSVTDLDGNTAVAFARLIVSEINDYTGQAQFEPVDEQFTLSSNASTVAGAQALAKLINGSLAEQQALAEVLLSPRFNMSALSSVQFTAVAVVEPWVNGTNDIIVGFTIWRAMRGGPRRLLFADAGRPLPDPQLRLHDAGGMVQRLETFGAEVRASGSLTALRGFIVELANAHLALDDGLDYFNAVLGAGSGGGGSGAAVRARPAARRRLQQTELEDGLEVIAQRLESLNLSTNYIATAVPAMEILLRQTEDLHSGKDQAYSDALNAFQLVSAPVHP